MTRALLLLLTLALTACAGLDRYGTIAQLREVEIEIVGEKIDGGLDKAIAGYERFLEEAKGTPMGAEAIRRLADLKVEREYGTIAQGSAPAKDAESLIARRAADAGAGTGGRIARRFRGPRQRHRDASAVCGRRDKSDPAG